MFEIVLYIIYSNLQFIKVIVDTIVGNFKETNFFYILIIKIFLSNVYPQNVKFDFIHSTTTKANSSKKKV